MIDQLWLQPPLAFARLGPSPKPCDNYRWGKSDLSPRGTGKTTVLPQPTLDLTADGKLTERMPQEEVQFKDDDGDWRPICPYFEVHGSWTVNGDRRTGPLTEEVLAEFGLELADVQWQVAVANLKAHHLTENDDDRIEAQVEVRGNDNQQHHLAGTSPQNAAQPLVPAGSSLPLGSVQVPVPNAALPELRLRFTPGTGAVYGPTNLPAGSKYKVPPERQILNPTAAWSTFRLLPSTDVRTNPAGLFAGAEDQQSVGLVDDVCDGLVSVSLPGGLTATARIVACPPVFAPDRRPFVSIADGLADRVQRGDVRKPEYVADKQQTTLEIRDLFERILETVGNINLDVQNGIFGALPAPPNLTGVLLGLTEQARRQHRRFVALEMLEDLFRERPGLIQQIIREPVADPNAAGAYNRRMPPDMRGADRNALHLTRRQYDLLVRWAAALREGTEAGS
ncbi:hypothetical protein [Streptomyces sp. NPDC058622]|uniref:hypothetical protein n=1 Tax=Streptomyces sp. NPDC058622 TaxID=3346562 RepID=UPI00365FD831